MWVVKPTVQVVAISKGPNNGSVACLINLSLLYFVYCSVSVCMFALCCLYFVGIGAGPIILMHNTPRKSLVHSLGWHRYRGIRLNLQVLEGGGTK